MVAPPTSCCRRPQDHQAGPRQHHTARPNWRDEGAGPPLPVRSAPRPLHISAEWGPGRFAVPQRRRPTIRSLVRARRPAAPRRESIDSDGLERGAEPETLPVSRLVDSAIYVDGERVASPESLAETFASLRQQPGGMAWIGLYRPEEHEVGSLASEFELHPLAVEDAIVAHQRPKLERYDDTLFVVLRPARYLDDVEEVEFGEVHVFVGPNFVLTVRHSEAPDLRHRPSSPRERAGTAVPRARGRPVRRGGQGRRRLLPRRRRARQGHRRDRDRGLQRRPQGVAAHLRTLPRGRRPSARHPPAVRPCSPP